MHFIKKYFITILFCSSISLFSQGTWTQKANFGSTARFLACGFSIGTKGYIGTGDDGVKKQDFWEWDKSTDTWTQKANFPGTVRTDAVGFSIGNKGYIGTGGSSVSGPFYSDFWEYDPSANLWTQKTNFGGSARFRATGFSIGTKGYIGTGWDGSFKNDFWEWDQATNTWTQKASFGGSVRWDAVGLSIGNKGYIGCGYATSTAVNDFWEWDQITNIWTQKANVGGSIRSAPVGFSINGKGYIGTGAHDPGPICMNDFWEWDPTNNVWTQKANYGGGTRADAVGFSIGNCGYIGTGYDGPSSNHVNYNDFWEYCPNSVATPTISSSGGTTICVGQNTILTASGGGNYSWNTGATTSSITVSPSTTTTYSVLVSNGCSCIDSSVVAITVQQCVGQCPNGTSPDTSMIINGDFSIGNTGFTTTYTYCNSSNCLYPLGNYGYSVGLNPNFFHNSFNGADHTTGTGNLMIVNGSDASLDVWREIIPVQTNSTYLFDLWICSVYPVNPAPINILINGIVIGSITAPPTINTWIQFSASWNSGANTSANICIKDQNTNWTGTDYGLDDISFRKCVGCGSVVAIISPDATICQGTNTTLSVSGGSYYSWNNGSTNSSIVVSPSSNTTYSVVVSNSSCSDTAFTSVSINQSPTAIAASNVTIAQGQSTTLTATGGGAYLWNNGETSTSIIVTPASTVQYCVTVTNTFGCSDSACVFVSVLPVDCPEIFLPNAFSPNGDNENDILLPQGTNCVKIFFLEIYNRWGEKVFSSNDVSKGWDGTYNGRKEGSAVYAYYLEAILYDGTIVKKKGNISLVR